MMFINTTAMKKNLLLVILLTIPIFAFAQTKFRSGIFLHHSTGDNIWGPNGSATSIPMEMTKYNSLHGYSGVNAVTMNHQWWPDGAYSGNNEWEAWHRIFENKIPALNIVSIMNANKIIVIKSCFPSSGIDRRGQPSDTLRPTDKTIYNYKWHWRHIVKVMQQRPDNFFVIWTNAPMTAGQTDANSAALSKSFCKWAKDTLAKGLDPVIGNFPKNIYVFDIFSKLTDATGYLMNQYAVSQGDSHPNAAATALIAPQFVSEIFDAAIYYEGILTGIEQNSAPDIQLYPNPAKDNVNITISNPDNNMNIFIFNLEGKQLLKQPVRDTNTMITISDFTPGVYLFRITNGAGSASKAFIKNEN